MLALAKVTARLVLAHWPVMLAWYLGALLVRYAVIEVAGWVAAYDSLLGILILPLAVLARIVALVAMLLHLRESMPALERVSPVPAGADARRRGFADALLAGILPFIAFYAAWGYLGEDIAAYGTRAVDVHLSRLLSGDTDAAFSPLLAFGPASVALLVVAFAGRWLWKKYRDRLPRILTAVAIYLETLWLFIVALFLTDLLGTVSTWVQTRQAMVWLADLRAWLTAQVVPVAWAWEAVEWLVGEIGGVILLPLAWLAIAGVIFGQSVAAKPMKIEHELIDAAKSRWGSVPAFLRRRLADLWSGFVDRFRPIGKALALMWRAGPVLVGGYILAYVVLQALESLANIGLRHAIGPNSLEFWLTNNSLIVLVVPILIEPIRLCLVSGAYDSILARLAHAPEGDAAAAGQAPASDGHAFVPAAHYGRFAPAAPGSRYAPGQGTTTTEANSGAAEPFSI